MTDIVVSALLLLGGFFAIVAGLGVVKLPDVLNRMHASTKAGTLGSSLALAAVAVHFGEAGVTVRALATFLFLLLTAPLAAHMIGRAAVRARSRQTGADIAKAPMADYPDGDRP